MVQLLYTDVTNGKNIALTIWILVNKVMSLLFNTLSSFVIAFLSRSKHLLILWLQSLTAVILQTKEIKSVPISTFSLSICHCVLVLDAVILVFGMLNFKPEFFALLFYPHQETLEFLFTVCHLNGIICISEVVDISPSNLDTSLWFIQLGIPHDVLCI